jgi:hypothetical protein
LRILYCLWNERKKKLIYLHSDFFLVELEIANRYYGVYNTHIEYTPIICTRLNYWLIERHDYKYIENYKVYV